MINQNENEGGLDARLQRMRILWGAFLMAIALFVVMTLIVPITRDESENSRTLMLLFMVMGFAMTVSSFVVRQVLLRRAVSEGNPAIVQTALIVGLALCETAVLFGVVSYFVTGHPYSYLLFIVGAVGELAHFPRRDHLLAASYGSGSQGVSRGL